MGDTGAGQESTRQSQRTKRHPESYEDYPSTLAESEEVSASLDLSHCPCACMHASLAAFLHVWKSEQSFQVCNCHAATWDFAT